MHTDRLATQWYYAQQFAHLKLYTLTDTLSESVNMLPQEGMLTLRRRLQYRAVWYRGVLPCCPFAPFFLTVCLSQPRRPISVTPLIQPTLPYQGKQQGRKGQEQRGIWKSIKTADSGNPLVSNTTGHGLVHTRRHSTTSKCGFVILKKSNQTIILTEY